MGMGGGLGRAIPYEGSAQNIVRLDAVIEKNRQRAMYRHEREKVAENYIDVLNNSRGKMVGSTCGAGLLSIITGIGVAIENETVRNLGIGGVLLCGLGILYGNMELEHHKKRRSQAFAKVGQKYGVEE